MNKEILNNTLKSASYNVIFQVFVRAVTFFLNALALRYLKRDIIGVINVRLLLLESTVLFISREAFRKAALSQTESHSWPQIINLMWLTVPLSMVTSVIFSYVWLNLIETPSLDITPHYKIGVWSVLMGCMIEMLSEPLNIVSQAYAFIKLKIALSALVILIRAVIFIPWIITTPKSAVIAFSFAQILSNMFYSIIYYSYFYCYICNNIKRQRILNSGKKITDINKKKMSHKQFSNEMEKEARCDFQKNENHDVLKRKIEDHSKEIFPFLSFNDFFPKALQHEKWIHPTSAYLTLSFFKQGILKQILTEGERYIMTLFSVVTFHEQGIFDVINNLGSLVVRFLFRPVEESLYFYFTQSIKRNEKIINQNQETMEEASEVLQKGLNAFVDVGALILTFGQSYSTLFLYLYGGNDLASEGTSLLKAYSFSVLLLGINGITECFVFSIMSPEQLNKHNYLMAVFSIFFLAISWGFTKLFGGVGFIIANCCNMSARILNSILFIKTKFSETPYQPLRGLLPTRNYSIGLLGAFIITKVTENYCSLVQHFFVGSITLGVVIGIWCFEKVDLLLLIIKKCQKKTKKNI